MSNAIGRLPPDEAVRAMAAGVEGSDISFVSTLSIIGRLFFLAYRIGEPGAGSDDKIQEVRAAIDQVSNQVRVVQETLNEILDRLGKMEARIIGHLDRRLFASRVSDAMSAYQQIQPSLLSWGHFVSRLDENKRRLDALHTAINGMLDFDDSPQLGVMTTAAPFYSLWVQVYTLIERTREPAGVRVPVWQHAFHQSMIQLIRRNLASVGGHVEDFREWQDNTPYYHEAAVYSFDPGRGRFVPTAIPFARDYPIAPNRDELFAVTSQLSPGYLGSTVVGGGIGPRKWQWQPTYRVRDYFGREFGPGTFGNPGLVAHAANVYRESMRNWPMMQTCIMEYNRHRETDEMIRTDCQTQPPEWGAPAPPP